MSLKTWKNEFLKTTAFQSMSKKEAIEHSILKWTGLLEKNLKKHGLCITLSGTIIEPDGSDQLRISGSNCALCVKYIGGSQCPKCPLSQHLGGRCDLFGIGKSQPYTHWQETRDPRPMIKALKALRRQ